MYSLIRGDLISDLFELVSDSSLLFRIVYRILALDAVALSWILLCNSVDV